MHIFFIFGRGVNDYKNNKSKKDTKAKVKSTLRSHGLSKSLLFIHWASGLVVISYRVGSANTR